MVDVAVLILIAGIAVTGGYWIYSRDSRTLTPENIMRWMQPHQLEGLDHLLDLPEVTIRPDQFLMESHGLRGLYCRAQNSFFMVRRCTYALEYHYATEEDLVAVRAEASRVYTSSAIFLCELFAGHFSKSAVNSHGQIALQAYWRLSRTMFQVASGMTDLQTLQPYF